MCVCGGGCACVHVCRLQVDDGNDTPSLFHFIPWGRVSQSNPNLIDMTNLTNQLVLGSPVSTLPGWNWRRSATTTLNLCGPRDPNSSPYTFMARAITTKPPTNLILSTYYFTVHPNCPLCLLAPSATLITTLLCFLSISHAGDIYRAFTVCRALL